MAVDRNTITWRGGVVNNLHQIIPLRNCELILGRNVRNLISRVNITNGSAGVQSDTRNQPIQINTMCSGDVTRVGTPAFDDHFY